MKTAPKSDPEEPIDSVLAEVYRVKEDLCKRWNYDIAAMVADARARQGKSGHKVSPAPTGKKVI